MSKKRKRESTSDSAEIDCLEPPKKKQKLDDQLICLFERGIKYFISRMGEVIKKDRRYVGPGKNTASAGQEAVIYHEEEANELYQIIFRYGQYRLTGTGSEHQRTCWVWQNGGVCPKYQRKGFFTRLLPVVEEWCLKHEEIQGILFQQVDTEHLAKFLRKKGYVKQQYHESNYYKLCYCWVFLSILFFSSENGVMKMRMI